MLQWATSSHGDRYQNQDNYCLYEQPSGKNVRKQRLHVVLVWKALISVGFVGSAPAGTLERWVPGWSVTTSPAWWTSSGSSASGTQTWCSPLAREPKSGSENASTSSGTTAGTAARWKGTTACSAEWCCEVSLFISLRGSCGHVESLTRELIILVNVSALLNKLRMNRCLIELTLP